MLKRKNTLMIVSLIFVLLMGLLLYLVSMPAPSKLDSSDVPAQTYDSIVSITDKKIVKISIKNSQESYEISSEQKEDKQMYILSGQDETKTSQSNARALFDSVINLKPTQIIDDIEDLSAYGLEEVNEELTVTFDNGEKITLYLGVEAPLSKGVYMRVSGDEKVYLINQMDAEIFLNEKSFYQEKEQN